MRAQLPPGPSLPRPLQSLGWWSRPTAFLEQSRARYGKRFTLRMVALPPFVMIADPDEVKQVFTAPPDVLHPGAGARLLETLIGRNSVILLDEAEHLEQRKLMLPAFHGERMERLQGLMAEVAEREAGSWPRDEPFAVHPRMQALTLEIILRAVFGLDPGPRLEALRDRLTEVLEFGNSPVSLIQPLQRRFGGLGPWAAFRGLQEEADALIFELIDERRAAAEDRDDVLSMLLAARHEDGTPMSEQELRDEMMTLLVAGHETTASSLAWAFVQLAGAPHVVARLCDELDAGDGDEYLTATIQETLRCWPVIPNAAPRLVRKPVEIGGWTYPPGVSLLASALLIHHDPEIYPDPYAFRPERFLDEGPGTYTWIPFGGGRRRCLGASFATMEMKVVLGAVLASVVPRQVGPHPELARRRSITLSPREGGRATLRARDRVPATVAQV